VTPEIRLWPCSRDGAGNRHALNSPPLVLLGHGSDMRLVCRSRWLQILRLPRLLLLIKRGGSWRRRLASARACDGTSRSRTDWRRGARNGSSCSWTWVTRRPQPLFDDRGWGHFPSNRGGRVKPWRIPPSSVAPTPSSPRRIAAGDCAAAGAAREGRSRLITR
jgi:hypothetical protein